MQIPLRKPHNYTISMFMSKLLPLSTKKISFLTFKKTNTIQWKILMT